MTARERTCVPHRREKPGPANIRRETPAGFVAATLTHTGNNLHDQSRVLQIWDRSRQLHVLTDWMLHDWR